MFGIQLFALFSQLFALFSIIYAKIDESNHMKFEHNFCESRLQSNNPPELLNAYSSLVISLVPFIFGIPKYQKFTNVAYCFILNGFASFHYHYYLTWSGKQGDEITMILANYFGLCGLIKMNYKKEENRKLFYCLNMCYMYVFFIINTFVKYDQLFPHLFTIYLIPTIYFVRSVANKYKLSYIYYLLCSTFGAACWIFSESICNHYTKYGHILWHCLFPLGFYQLLLKFDNLYQKISTEKTIKINSAHKIDV